MTTLGLDIGGANLKAALADGTARSVPFALWRAPQDLTERLRRLLAELPCDRLAVTMTGELCDCFETKREGVQAILDGVTAAAPDVPIRVWSTTGRFVSAAEARDDPWRVASANWHALATFAGRLTPEVGGTVLLDIGSTTTDIIPIQDGRPLPRGFTDPERLASGELVYTGVRRTPLCAILGMDAAAELFATTLDVYLTLGMIGAAPDNRDTADGRPATPDHARARLARMRCSDTDRFSPEMALEMAQQVRRLQVDRIAAQARRAAATLSQPMRMLLAGEGEFLGREVAELMAIGDVISLRQRIGPKASEAACAFAVAMLAGETEIDK